MSDGSPLSAPTAWNLVAEGYAEEMLSAFKKYSTDALDRAELTPDDSVVDVATGPGTLALLAAERVKEVAAFDFSESMLAIARRRAAEIGASNVTFQQADGQKLPLEDEAFDAGFSMFGLMFFPDRAAGFSELYRVLKAGGRVVVSSWTPAEESPLLATLFAAMQEALPELPFGKGGAGPLSNTAEFTSELEQAGFRDVRIDRVIHHRTVDSVREFWEVQERGSAPIALIRQKMSEPAWEDFSAKVLKAMEHRLGTGPIEYGWSAFLGTGRK